MHISGFQIRNFKSFQQTEVVRLGPGFNIVVGKNDAGKSTLVESLSTRFRNVPHRSIETLPDPNSPVDPTSTCDVEFHMDEGDVLTALKKRGVFAVAVPEGLNNDQALKLFMEIGSLPGKFRLSVRGDGTFGIASWEHHPANPYRLFSVQYSPQIGDFVSAGHGGSEYQSVLAGVLRSRIYAFRAERLHVSSGPISENSQLEPDARNLAGVLNRLQSANVSRFERLCSAVNIVFPHIRQITVPPVGGAAAQIFVWSIDPETEREDLAVSLAESGTGIGQVLAILYVVLTANEPQTIIIDEPQSFLHPGAVRKLIGILQQFPMHQYIITTHSPTVVTSAVPDQLLLIRRTGAESLIEMLDPQQTSQAQALLSEVGARLADVFGADNILWVEGQTEELCFPSIVRKVLNRPLFGTEILAILNTGDLESRHARSSLEIYRRLSQGRGLLPPAIGFILDREQRSDKEKKDLVRMSGQRTYFTPRRMYENYLLRPAAIAAVVADIQDFRESPVLEDEISQWIDSHRWEQKYFGFQVQSSTRTSEFWMNEVHGAKVLKDLFEELSENRVSFEKTRHSLALTEWLLEHFPTDLHDIAQLLASALDVTDNSPTVAKP